MAKKTFKFVYIPCEQSDPIEQWQEVQPKGKEVECLLDRLKEHFKKGAAAELTEEAKQRNRKALLSHLPKDVRKNVSADLLDVAGGLQLVESIALLPNTMKNGFVAVNMYVDDKGAIRNLPLNQRASGIASCCGHPIEVRGDAFLARIMDNEEDFDRLDFTVDEVSSSAEWVKAAQKYHSDREKQESMQDAMARIRSNAAAGPKIVELTPAEEEKEKGNVAFKAGKYESALEHYSQAISHDPDMCLAFNNRAMAYLRLNKFVEGEADASRALELEPQNVKAMFRRGVAREALGKIPGAIEDFSKVVELEPANLVAKKKLEALQGVQEEVEG
ncbi:hypothetical protein BSKO_04214 [Bryopsis sp. KO-2023]|nr:hypothetical protein BSKO_04214 [Bryopsis sp. KO-2023]